MPLHANTAPTAATPQIDGVTHYHLEFQRAAPPAAWQVQALLAWRDRCRALGIVGQQADRYEGVGFGNLSCRHPGRPDAFIITGTQTGARTRLGPHDCAIVVFVDATANRVAAHGGTAPSSEAMTHAQFYALDSRIDCVFHGHAPGLWHAARALGIPSTPAAVPYGTPAMAEAVRSLLRPHRDTPVALPGILQMGGHEDGVIAFGTNADETGACLETWLRRAASND